MAVRNPELSDDDPRKQIARLNSNRGLIIIATEVVVYREDKRQTESIKVPETIVAASVLHELSGHAAALSLGQPLAHGQPPFASDLNKLEMDELFSNESAKDWASLNDRCRRTSDS